MDGEDDLAPRSDEGNEQVGVGADSENQFAGDAAQSALKAQGMKRHLIKPTPVVMDLSSNDMNTVEGTLVFWRHAAVAQKQQRGSEFGRKVALKPRRQRPAEDTGAAGQVDDGYEEVDGS